VTVALPPHVAAADEPIPAPSEHPLRNEPDMRAVTPLEVMLAKLAHVADDVAFVQQFRSFVSEIGLTVMAHFARDGEVRLNVGGPVDRQVRHRHRWMHFLVERLDAVESRRALLLRQLVDERISWDERPVDPRATTLAIRSFLSHGGRLLIDPEGRLREDANVAAWLGAPVEPTATIGAARRAYFDMRNRHNAAQHIRRAVRLLGYRTDNGWLVLEQAGRTLDARWSRAMAEYRRLRADSDSMPLGHADEDAAVDAYCAAMDRLLIAVPAPDLVAVASKMELAGERGDGGVEAAYATAIAADVRRLIGRAEFVVVESRSGAAA